LQLFVFTGYQASSSYDAHSSINLANAKTLNDPYWSVGM